MMEDFEREMSEAIREEDVVPENELGYGRFQRKEISWSDAKTQCITSIVSTA